MDEHAVLVSDVNDHDLLAVVLAVVNEANSAWLNKVFVSLQKANKKDGRVSHIS